MKKINKLILILCLIMAAFFAFVACDPTDESAFEVQSIDGYSSAVINKTAKSISFTVPNAVESFNLTAIKFSTTVETKAYSDSARTDELTSITLEVGANTFYLVFTADNESENWKLSITREDVEPSISVTGVDGYSSAVINSTAKTISFTVLSTVNTFNLTSIKFASTTTVKAYSDSARTNELTAISLNSGVNTFYLVFTAGDKSENWTLSIVKTTYAQQAESISVTSFETIYEIDDVFGGGVISVTYVGGNKVDVDLTEAMLSDFDTATAGTKVVTISYDGATAQVSITVVGAPEPTEIDPEEVKNEIASIVAFMYAAVSGEMLSAEEILEMMETNVNNMEDAFNGVLEFFQESAFSKDEVIRISEIAQDAQSVVSDVMTAIDEYDGTGHVVSAELISRVFEVYHDLTDIVTPLRAVYVFNFFFKMAEVSLDVSSSSIHRVSFDEAIAAAEAMGLSDIKASLEAQKDLLDEETSLSSEDIPSFTDKELFQSFESIYRLMDVLAAKDPNDIVRVIDVVFPMVMDTENAMSGDLNFEDIAFVCNFFGQIMLDMEEVILYIAEINLAMLEEVGMESSLVGSVVSSMISSSYALSGYLLKSIDAETLEAVCDIAMNVIIGGDISPEDTARLAVYVARLFKAAYNSIPTDQRVAFIVDLKNVLDLAFASSPDISVFVVDLITIAEYDPNDLTETQVDEILELFSIVDEFVPHLSSSTDLLREFVCVPKDMTQEDFIEFLSYFYYLNIYTEVDMIEVDFSEADITGFDAESIGLRTFSISVEVDERMFELDVKYYVYDDTSIDEFVLLTKDSYYHYDEVVCEIDTPAIDYNGFGISTYVRYDFYLYNTQYDFVINLYVGTTFEIIGFDASSVGRKTGFVNLRIANMFDFYVAVEYAVYDPDDITVTGVECFARNAFEEGETPVHFGVLRIDYNDGLFSRHINITEEMVSDFGDGTYTVTFECEGETFVFECQYDIFENSKENN